MELITRIYKIIIKMIDLEIRNFRTIKKNIIPKKSVKVIYCKCISFISDYIILHSILILSISVQYS